MVAQVYVDNEILSLEPSRVLHPSDATFEWGYFGGGPSQTSLAILFDATEDKDNSLKYMHEFKAEFIATAEYATGFTILQSQIKDWLAARIARDNNQNMGGWMI